MKNDNSPQEMSPKPAVSSLILDEDSQESQTSAKVHIMDCDGNGNSSDLTIDDIRLLVEFFYLPFQHGPHAQQIYVDFHWLRFNYFTNSDVCFFSKSKTVDEFCFCRETNGIVEL